LFLEFLGIKIRLQFLRKNCNRIFIPRNSRNSLVKSVSFYLERLHRYGDLNLCNFLGYPVLIYALNVRTHYPCSQARASIFFSNLVGSPSSRLLSSLPAVPSTPLSSTLLKIQVGSLGSGECCKQHGAERRPPTRFMHFVFANPGW